MSQSNSSKHMKHIYSHFASNTAQLTSKYNSHDEDKHLQAAHICIDSSHTKHDNLILPTCFSYHHLKNCSASLFRQNDHDAEVFGHQTMSALCRESICHTCSAVIYTRCSIIYLLAFSGIT